MMRIVSTILLIFVTTISIWPTHAQTSTVASPTIAGDRKAAVDRSAECKPPEYPVESEELNEEGAVLVSYLIDVDGMIKDRKIETSSGFALLDQAALAGIGQCKFIPAVIDGKLTMAWAKVKFTWKLADQQNIKTRVNARLDPQRICVAPVRSISSIRNGETGTTRLEILVELDGRVSNTKIFKSSGHEELDQAVVSSIIKCRFLPSTINGVPTKDWSQFSYSWNGGGFTSTGIDMRFPCKIPEYPSESLKLKESGLTVIRVQVDIDGIATASIVEKSSGFERLDEALRLAALNCQYHPDIKLGSRISPWLFLMHEWKLPPDRSQ